MSVRTWPDAGRKLAFLACGATGFALYSVVSWGLVASGTLRPEAAAFVAVLAAVPPTFLLQKRVAFRHRGDALPSFAKYCALQVVNALLIAGLVRLGRWAGVPDAPNLVASAALVVVVSWFALSRGVFNDRTTR